MPVSTTATPDMPINTVDLQLRMRDSRAESVAIFANGLIRVFHRWGSVDFPSVESFNKWIKTGELPRGATTKFADFRPHQPN